MNNNKGFTMVELLAVVAIMGILTGLAMMAYSRYINYSLNKAYKMFDEAVVSAAEEYVMDHPTASEVTISQLISDDYLEAPSNERMTKGKNYRGKVLIRKQDNAGGLDSYVFTLNMCFEDNYYTYFSETKIKNSDKACKADPYNVEDVPNIKVLNVYPTSGADGLKSWMNSYGKGKIDVTSVTIGDFNSKPGDYLGSAGNWKYDEIVFGFWDCNANKDLSEAAAKLVDTYLSSGGAAIFGHDTITAAGCGSHTNFNTLAKHVNVEPGPWHSYPSGTEIQIAKKGIFTTYPWDIGEVGKKLTIPKSHVYGQTAKGEVWITFTFSGSDADKVYLSTYGNNAFIQTGHSNGAATEDEQKVIANIIFYMIAKQYVSG